MTEDQAVMRCQHGERNALRYLVERYQDVVFGPAYDMTRKRALADELAQGSFLTAWKGIRSFRVSTEVLRHVADDPEAGRTDLADRLGDADLSIDPTSA